MRTLTYQQLVVMIVVMTASALIGTAPSKVRALSFDTESGWLLSVDTSLTAATQWRTESRDKAISANPILNDGNNNFDKGTLVSAKGSFILELGGTYENFAFFLRGDGLYDYAYEDQKSDMSAENYLSYNGGIPSGGDLKRGEFPDGTLDEHGQRLRLLEAFVNYEFRVGEQAGSVRLGRQVLGWGEATIYQGVNTMQNPIDGGVALSPGVEAKEIFLPTGAVDLKWNFTNKISAEAYYMLEWEETTQPGVGSFLSTSDITGPGAKRITFGPLQGDVISAIEPDADGQWGTALRYLTDQGNTFGLSYTRHHANAPVPQVFQANGELFAREVYLEDIEFWQLSASTNLGEALVYLDLAYSENAQFIDKTIYGNDQGQLILSDASRGYYRQAVLGMTDLYTAFPWLAPQIVLTAEMLYQSNNLGSNDKKGTPYQATDDAWGYQLLVFLRYFAVLPGLDIDIPISFRHDVNGYGGAMLKNNLVQGQKWASVGASAVYLTNWEFAAKYSFYFGNDDPNEPVLSDRDNIALSMKYKF